MMLKLEFGSTISCQNTFGSDSPFANLKKVSDNSDTKLPNYRDFIPQIKLRRLTPILRMALVTAIHCEEQFEQGIDGIVIGTALGCLTDTQKFLREINDNVGMALSPTSFIQSTHNTVSGQISLFLKNHEYNMTHSQLNLSFEMSILDCMNTFATYEDKNLILLGAADEKIDFLAVLQADLISAKYPLTEISTSFIVRPTSNLKRGDVVIENVLFDYTQKEIMSMLIDKQLDLAEFDLVLHSDNEVLDQYPETETINYLDYSGMNYSASAFATHLAFDLLSFGKYSRILIVNDICTSSTGFILLRTIE